jgi:hypothetical protein
MLGVGVAGLVLDGAGLVLYGASEHLQVPNGDWQPAPQYASVEPLHYKLDMTQREDDFDSKNELTNIRIGCNNFPIANLDTCSLFPATSCIGRCL